MKHAKTIIGLTIALFAYKASADPLLNKTNSQYSTYLVGTYTTTQDQGIEILNFNQENMVLSAKVAASGIKDPSFVIANRDRSLIFAVESSVVGKVSSYTFNQNQQSLELIQTVESFGNHPCYIALDNSERLLAVANYESGDFSIYAVESGGKLLFKQLVKHHGSSTNKHRQNSAHVHSLVFHPNSKQLIVTDLGTDKIYIYDVNFSSTNPITPAYPAYFKVADGSGPRHLIVHPNGKVLYVVHELTGEIGIYFYEDGKITHASTQPLTTPKFKGDVQAAEVRISADGNFIYASNRGTANDISVFKINPDGTLQLTQQISTGGKTPRNFNLSLDGRFLLVANQDSDEIRVFQRDNQTGRLTTTSSMIKINEPVYIFPFH